MIAESLRRWSVNNRGDALSFVDLLRTLPVVVPADLLEIIYQGESSRALFDLLLTITPTVPPIEVLCHRQIHIHCIIIPVLFLITLRELQVKRAYLKAIRFIHPDKLPADLAIESKALLVGYRIYYIHHR